MNQISFAFAIRLTIALHFFGFLGMILAFSRPLFIALTPLNLIICSIFLIRFQATWQRDTFIKFFGIAALIGFGMEVLGVQTGVIFGEYTYGEPLGIKVLGVPLVIGLNWAVLTVVCGTLIENKLESQSIWLKAVLTALMMTLLDVLIEPVAIHFEWWTWANPEILLQNYLAWFAIAFGIAFLFFRMNFQKRNPFGVYLLLSQLAFFIAHNLMFYLS